MKALLYKKKIPLFLPHGSILPEWIPVITSNISFSVNAMKSYFFINLYPNSSVVGKRLQGEPRHQHPAGRLWVSKDRGAQRTYFCVRSRRGIITSTYISWPRTQSYEPTYMQRILGSVVFVWAAPSYKQSFMGGELTSLDSHCGQSQLWLA